MLLSRLEHHHRQQDDHRPIRRQSGLVPLTLLLKPRLPLPPHTTPGVVDTPPPLMWECHLRPCVSPATLCPAPATQGAPGCQYRCYNSLRAPRINGSGGASCRQNRHRTVQRAHCRAHYTARASQLLNRGIVVSGD